jgi:hypothetical protein
MDGSSEIDSPSKINRQSVGAIGMTTRFPQPQQHLWMAVAYGIEIKIVPSANSSGMNSTN